MAYGHAKVDLGRKKMRKVNTLSNYALEQIVKGKRSFGDGNTPVSKEARSEALYILKRRQDKKFRDKIGVDK